MVFCVLFVYFLKKSDTKLSSPKKIQTVKMYWLQESSIFPMFWDGSVLGGGCLCYEERNWVLHVHQLSGSQDSVQSSMFSSLQQQQQQKYKCSAFFVAQPCATEGINGSFIWWCRPIHQIQNWWWWVSNTSWADELNLTGASLLWSQLPMNLSSEYKALT